MRIPFVVGIRQPLYEGLGQLHLTLRGQFRTTSPGILAMARNGRSSRQKEREHTERLDRAFADEDRNLGLDK